MAIIGIDLGTTNSLVSYWTEDGAVIIPNSLGQNLTPSVISIDNNGDVLVGQIAKERQIAHPELSASVFKRNMGTKKKYVLGTKEFIPEELSAILLKALKEDAEHFLGTKVTEAVISVPAYFSDAQRKATKRAGELAGLRVDRLITEPTAAAIAYGLHLRDTENKFLVFDLGGGTFDVSILELFDNIMEVRAVAGDNFLGGEDFTEILVNMFLKHHSLTTSQLGEKDHAMLKKQAEVAKRDFSEKKVATVACLINEEELKLEITLDEYEAATKHLFQRLREPVERALSDASLKISDIDSILLVGGATKLPLIRSFVSRLFGKLAYANINPDEVVALGAGVQAALKGKDASIKEVILTDVCPYTLGTSVTVRKSQGFHEPGHFLPIIERNTTIPVSKVERLYTIYDNQKIINVDILQGESRLSKDNIFLGELNVPVPPKTAGEEAIDVRFTYDINGILEVEVTVVSTGLKKNMIIEKEPGHMTSEEIVESIKSISHLKIHPRENHENKLVVARGERLYEEKIGRERQEIAQLLMEFEEILDKQDLKKVEECRKKLTDIFDSIDTKGGF
ncbi:molecular chaperone HscC [Pseudobacteroides cellulosolvens]|uniref:Chaperone protein DnaK n=1 Tax=Pseudobacteroides cellulosolvens ATCC 35603 = DSM 2933 TaxID=398512 RepID=A0A0L6JTN4_9FIRM|nr:molecular chaperone HscC [Pseudobacteroides cellulosolvens]KNY29183.1 Heat shock protein 70 [Pseudobacteroides cellulosolvens ATCC 35603 = DSM 2933]